MDMRAALAALYWRAGEEAAAEAEWDFACDSISVGCGKYSDPDWLFRIRWVVRSRQPLGWAGSGSAGRLGHQRCRILDSLPAPLPACLPAYLNAPLPACLPPCLPPHPPASPAGGGPP